VPAAGGEAAEQRPARCGVVEVERLRIELRRIGLDLRLIDDVGRAGEAPADLEVLEVGKRKPA
jgi:hypothetical protein